MYKPLGPNKETNKSTSKKEHKDNLIENNLLIEIH